MFNVKGFIVLLIAIASQLSFAQSAQGVFRPSKEMLSFKLVDSSTSIETDCFHELLSHVPWWKVTCGDRAYTVDIWLQIRERGDLKENKLMYHVKESVSSSGTKITQFKSHFTSFISRGDAELLGVVSQIDVRNGLADLVVTVN